MWTLAWIEFSCFKAFDMVTRPPGVSTPYLSLGYVYATLTLDNVRASLHGGFANAGYEWKWRSGLAILVGGGAAVLASISATDGVTVQMTNGMGACWESRFGEATTDDGTRYQARSD